MTRSTRQRGRTHSSECVGPSPPTSVSGPSKAVMPGLSRPSWLSQKRPGCSVWSASRELVKEEKQIVGLPISKKSFTLACLIHETSALLRGLASRFGDLCHRQAFLQGPEPPEAAPRVGPLVCRCLLSLAVRARLARRDLRQRYCGRLCSVNQPRTVPPHRLSVCALQVSPWSTVTTFGAREWRWSV